MCTLKRSLWVLLASLSLSLLLTFGLAWLGWKTRGRWTHVDERSVTIRDNQEFSVESSRSWIYAEITKVDRSGEGTNVRTIRAFEVGWPCRCFYHSLVFAGEDGLRLDSSASVVILDWRRDVFPFAIYHGKFLLNIAVLVAASLLIQMLSVGVFVSLRKSLRYRAGRCVACGYPLIISTQRVCPECGGHRRL